MSIESALIAIEKELDNKVNSLSIWEVPFQTIISQLLLGIDAVANQKDIETAIDYCSRLSYIYNIVKNKSAKAGIISTSEAIQSIDAKYIDDIKFLNAYAHFCLLMPQIHRGCLVPIKIEDKFIELDYSSQETEFAEIIDSLYSLISLQFAVRYNKENQLIEYFDNKILNPTINTSLSAIDFLWIKELYEHFKIYSLNIEVLPSKVLEEVIGMDFKEYISFVSTIRAFSYYWLKLGSCFLKHSLQLKESNPELSNKLMTEYFEFMVNAHDFKILGFFMEISNLSLNKVIKGISHYLSIYTNNTGVKFTEKAFCGDGFFPPFILFDKCFISSVYASFYMLNINNILYSINKLQPKLFNEKVSKHLEPTLINQLIYLFSSLDGIETRKNINYSKGEIDLIVLSEKENTCLIIQVKATIAPDSSRTVERVQTRSLEGIDQIDKFRQISIDEKLNIVNECFNKSFTELNFIDLLVVRSCAGSETIWKKNDEVKIANYALLVSITAKKLKNKDYSIMQFESEIKAAQEELIRKSSFKKEFNNLIIGDYTFRFPNLDFNMLELCSSNFSSFEFLPEYDRSHS